MIFDGPFSIVNLLPAHNISFSNGEKEVGRIDFSTGQMEFSGDIAESAKVFFDYLKDSLIDPYLKSKKLPNDSGFSIAVSPPGLEGETAIVEEKDAR